MALDTDFEIYFYGLIGSVPLLVMYFIGGVLCVLFARQNPKACTLTGIAIAIAIATRLVLPLVSNWLFAVALNDIREIKWRMFANSLLYALPAALSLGLMLWAIFGTTPRGHGRHAAILLDEGPHRSGAGPAA